MTCACGKTATYRVGELGYCSAHRDDAVRQIEKMGMPRARKKKTSKVVLRHVDKPTRKDRRVAKQKELKANATEAELTLKKLLWNHPNTKGQWVFQPIVLGYFPDFLCPKAKLIVELDGWQHYTEEGLTKDYHRTAALGRKGYKVIRFPNKRIFINPSEVLRTIITEQAARVK